MILKERNPQEHAESDEFASAGAKAEECMAFYLKRAFGESPDVLVFNDLRFEDDTDDSCQIDHLVQYRHGFVLIESKSVTSEVKINSHGEWTRVWNGQETGMPSPVQQARRQAEFLQRALGANAEDLMDKILGLRQPRFRNCPFDILVAISDKGKISRQTNIPEVLKADMVVDRIRAIIARQTKAASFLTPSLTTGFYTFKNHEMKRIADFVFEHHMPLGADSMRPGVVAPRAVAATPRPAAKPPVLPVAPPPRVPIVLPVPKVSQAPAPPPPAKAAALGVCSKCGAQCNILWGNSYYWKCPACNNNMAIKEYCPTCRDRKKLRKAKNRFFIFCEKCRTESLYYEFPA